MRVISYIIFYLVAVVSIGVSAQSKTVEKVAVTDNDSSHLNVNGIQVDKGYLDYWGLDKKEYERYLFIKNNTARSYFTPNSNPLVYLGLEARTVGERKKYAEKVAMLEWENSVKVKEFMMSIQEASIQLFGRGSVLDIAQGNEFEEKLKDIDAKNNPTTNNQVFNSRTLFVKIKCFECISSYKKLYSQLLTGEIARIEIVFADGSDADKIQWAKTQKIPLDLNNRGVILLRSFEGKEEDEVTKFPTINISAI